MSGNCSSCVVVDNRFVHYLLHLSLFAVLKVELVDRQYEKEPKLLGPTMIHMQTKAESYKFFGSLLVSLDDELSNILAIGSDRDTALRKEFSSFFPIATQLCCKGHLAPSPFRSSHGMSIII